MRTVKNVVVDLGTLTLTNTQAEETAFQICHLVEEVTAWEGFGYVGPGMLNQPGAIDVLKEARHHLHLLQIRLRCSIVADFISYLNSRICSLEKAEEYRPVIFHSWTGTKGAG